jgi:hypothetical protein
MFMGYYFQYNIVMENDEDRSTNKMKYRTK